jgi:hypothetical protein
MRTQHAIIKKERHFQLHDKHMKNIRIDSSKKRVVILYIYLCVTCKFILKEEQKLVIERLLR